MGTAETSQLRADSRPLPSSQEQADAPHHVNPRMLDHVVRAITLRSFDVPFLHLGRAGMVSSTSPCKRAIFRQVTGREMQATPRSYCCAHFVVRRDVLLRSDAVSWAAVLEAMDAPLPAGCEAVRTQVGLHCLIFESMWHALFGLHEQLSPRSQDGDARTRAVPREGNGGEGLCVASAGSSCLGGYGSDLHRVRDGGGRHPLRPVWLDRLFPAQPASGGCAVRKGEKGGAALVHVVQRTVDWAR